MWQNVMPTYILRVAENEAGEFCGLSMTILREMHQIATASLGVTGKGIKMVIGLGLSDNNYWWEFTANRRQRNSMTTLSGVNREWVADKEMDFSYVSAKVAPVSNLDWHCYITKSGKRYLWDASIYEDLDQAGYRYLMSSDGKVNTNTNELDFTIALGDSDRRAGWPGADPGCRRIRYGAACGFDGAGDGAAGCADAENPAC